MKRFLKYILVLFVPVIMIISCDEFPDINSDRIVTVNEYDLRSANDTLYAMFGVYAQLQKIADSYILLGELRGDLMDVGEITDRHLIEISTFNISASNPYTGNIKDYYAVINNCNYILSKLDTTIVTRGDKRILRTYAAAKAVRAWTYWQIMLNYGKVTYYEKPILTLDDAQAQYPVYTDINTLADVLINDILPYKNVEKPDYGLLSTFDLQKSLFPVRYLLGDMYLWKGEYEKAATEFRDLIFAENILITNDYSSYYQVQNGVFTGNAVVNWVNVFDPGASESVIELVLNNKYQLNTLVDSLAEIRRIVPSAKSIENWSGQHYFVSETLDTLGDLRRYGSYSRMYDSQFNLLEKYSISKYELMNFNLNYKRLMICRAAGIYLKYAEAVNRLGKPNLAMAVLKNGLRATTITSNVIVPPSERDSVLPLYMDFRHDKFNNNIGIRARVCRDINKDTINYIIPKNLTTTEEKVTFVEDLIINESALELAFEGNRFHDLMRIALRRNDNAYLADKVAGKHPLPLRESIRTKLNDKSNWFLK